MAPPPVIFFFCAVEGEISRAPLTMLQAYVPTSGEGETGQNDVVHVKEACISCSW